MAMRKGYNEDQNVGIAITSRAREDRHERVVHRYNQPFRDGSTHMVLDPLDFMARKAALVPSGRATGEADPPA